MILIGTLASTVAVNAASANEHSKQKRAETCGPGICGLRNLIDIDHAWKKHPMYTLIDIQKHSAMNFSGLHQQLGEVDRCATYHRYPEWYNDYPDRDPNFNSANNPNDRKEQPITFSQTLGFINEYKSKTSGAQAANDWTFWNLETSGAQATILTFTYKDTWNNECQNISLYYNVAALTHHANDDGFVAVIPGTASYLYSTGETIRANVADIYQTTNDGTYLETHDIDMNSLLPTYMPTAVPTIFDLKINLKEIQFQGNAVHNHILNPYMMVNRAGRGGDSHAYYGKLLKGFKVPEHCNLPDELFRDGDYIFDQVAYQFNAYVYLMLNKRITW